MITQAPGGRTLLALTGRDPADAIVQATLVQQLQVIGVAPEQVQVVHVVASTSEPEWFVSVERHGEGGVLRRYTALLHTLVRRLRTAPPAALYTRDVVTVQWAFLARMLAGGGRSVPIVFDCRGDIVAEAELRGTKRLRLAVLRWMQNRAWRRADRVMTVSGTLARDIQSAARGVQVAVVPNLQPCALNAVESAIPRPLVVFAGGAQAWQDPEQALNQLGVLKSSGIDVEVISRDPGLRERAESAGFASSSGDRAHVMSRLQRATGSWMVRADAAANAVASPVKLGEALAAGALVIGSSSTWEHMDRLVADQLAVQVTETDDLKELAGRLHAVWREGIEGRDLRLATVEKNWTLEAYGDALRWFFGVEKAG